MFANNIDKQCVCNNEGGELKEWVYHMHTANVKQHHSSDHMGRTPHRKDVFQVRSWELRVTWISGVGAKPSCDNWEQMYAVHNVTENVESDW